MELKPATHALVPIWRSFRDALFGEVPEDITAFDIDRILRDPDQHCVIAFQHDKPIGFAEIGLRNLVDGCRTSPVAYLEAIYIDPPHRGCGLGREIMAYIERWAVGKGCSELATDTSVDDADAQRFHRESGFEETDRIVQFRMAIPTRKSNQ